MFGPLGTQPGPTLDSLIEFIESIVDHAEISETIGRELLGRMGPGDAPRADVLRLVK